MGRGGPSQAGAGSFGADRLWALALLLLLGLHGWFKWTWGTLPELLWACNIASFATVLGLGFRSPAVTGMALLWHLGIGEPAWLYEVVRTGHSHWVSVLVHTLPALAAFLSLRRTGLPRSAPWLALLMFALLLPISLLTPPQLNINLAHQRPEILQRLLPGTWSYRPAFGATVAGLLLLWDLALGRLLGRPGRLER